MNAGWLVALLVAQVDRFSELENLRRGFTRQAADSNLLAVCLVAAALCGLVVLLDRVYRARDRSRKQAPKRRDYLVAVANVLGLSRSETRLVRTVAALAHISPPASILLSPANLAWAVQSAGGALGDAGLRARVNELCQRLFGTDLPSEGGSEAVR